MTNWRPKPVAIQDEFSTARSGAEIAAIVDRRLKSLSDVVMRTPLHGALKVLKQACLAVDSGSDELAVLGCRAAIESTGYTALTRVPLGAKRFSEQPPIDLAGRVRRVEFGEILDGMRSRKLDPKLAEAAGIVQFYGNAVAHYGSRLDVTSGKVWREILSEFGPPKSKEDKYILVPVHTPSHETALEAVRVVSRIVILVARVMSRVTKRRSRSRTKHGSRSALPGGVGGAR